PQTVLRCSLLLSMTRRPPRSTLFSLHDALPIWEVIGASALACTAAVVGVVALAIARRFARPGPTTAPERTLRFFRYSPDEEGARDRKSTRLNSSHDQISYAVFCLKKKNQTESNY